MNEVGQIIIRRLARGDLDQYRQLMAMFGEAFGEQGTYTAEPPRDAYAEQLLDSDRFIALVALAGEEVVGGLAAYVLAKFEQERQEIYIYDLAVAAAQRRKGMATALIDHLKRIAKSLGAHVIFVQADQGDDAAIALYSKLGRREDVLHFDIETGRAEDD